MEEEERFVLDAEVLSVIDNRAFRARLDNGHEFVAFFASRMCGASGSKLQIGSRICVKFSPCDLSKAAIVETVESEGKR